LRLYLLRHAIAHTRDRSRFPDDSARPLTRDGARRMIAAARGLRVLKIRCDLLLTSPLARARETARLVRRALHPRPPMRVLRPLAPGGGAGGVIAGLTTLPRDQSILLVGHEPDLSRLLATLIAESRDGLAIGFKKGGLARVDCPGSPRPGNGRLIYHLPPRILRRLAKKGR
jgi:phosphohistidine phosphatase